MALSDACEDVHRVDFSYPFLKGIDPSCPPSSIVVPPKYLDAMGNMERQYWEIKAKRYNVMIFFKKGKFYELYDYDAVIANREFGLKMVFDTTNRGKMRLAGVPEQSFSEWARLFVFRGYKVGRVEQLREDAAESSGAAKAKIVPRELVEVLTPGTLTDPAMLSDHREVFLLAVAAAPNTDARVVDAFAVDLSRHVVYWCPCGSPLDVERYREAVAAGRSTSQDAAPTGAMSSAFNEDAANALTALLQRLNPKEIIIADTAAHTASASIAKWIESEGYRVETVTPMAAGSNSSSAITSSAARQVLTDYFRFLKLDRHVPLLDEAVQYVSHLKTENSSQQQQKSVAADELAQSSSELSWERRNDPGLVLDAATVSNLEIVANLQDGSEKHSLHTYLNQCVTNGGKRLFRSWMLRPASTARVIAARQDVVRYLVDTQLFIAWGEGGASSSSQRLSSQLLGSDTTSPSSAATTQPGYSQGAGSTSPTARKRPRASTGSFDNRFGNAVSVDFERNISRLAEIKMDAEHRISYVDPLVQYRKNLSIILTTVEAFIEMVEWSRQFEVMCEEQGSVVPALLREILASIRAAAPSVEVITGLFDRQAASETGLLTPAPGTSTEYDAAVERLTALEEKMHAIRGKIQAEHFHGATATFTDLGKDLFLLEVAAHDAPKMTPPGMVERARSSKSVKYCVDALAQLAEAHKAVTITKSNALLNVLQRVAGKICEHWSYLYTATSSLAYFDCLMNLARFHHRAAVKTFPIIADYAAAGTAVIRASDLVHPLLTCVSASSPVPNSVSLDAESGRLLLLTGPNMAGKSTLMRTVAVNVILAQLGGPCMGAAMMLSPVDRIFTRIGARDASHKGQSTLFVELNETAELLRCATGRSLCLVDELGRGTSTHDGLAIAHATLHALKGYAVPPLTLFSTHYHALAMEESRHSNNNNNNEGERAVGKVQLGYMNFALGEGASSTADEANNTTSAAGGGALPTITFLHKLVPGICDRSYGVEVALMAGIPPTLVHLARRKSAELAQRSASHEDVEAIRKFLK